MTISGAFGALAEVLHEVESSGAAIRRVDVPTTTGVDDGEGDDHDLAVDLTVGLPLVAGDDRPAGVDLAADADGVAVGADGRVEVDLTVSVPAAAARERAPPAARRVGRVAADAPGGGDATDESTPAYKDPEALRAAYEACDTFPEMREALDADVTSETVRRHMVDEGIHDPTGDTSDDAAAAEPAVSAGAATAAARGASADRSDTDAEDESGAGEASGVGDRPVAELLAAGEEADAGDGLVADGLGVPRDLTVAGLTRIVNESATLHEAERALDLGEAEPRRLLRELNLLDVVTHRLAAGEIDLSRAEVARRIRSASR
jgi:hypothetical protein